VLKEVNGETDMDLHISDNQLIENLLYNKNGYRIAGTPNSLNVLLKYSYLDTTTASYRPTTALAVSTTEDFHIVDIADMATIYDHANMFYSGSAENEESLYASFVTYGAVYFSDKGVNFSNYDLVYGEGGVGKFGDKLSVSGNCKPNRHIVVSSTGTYYFDELNKRFLACSDNGLLLPFDNSYAGANPGHGYQPNEMTHELKFMGNHEMISDQPWAFAIMQDQDGKSYLYELEMPDAMEMMMADWGYDVLYNPIQAVTDISNQKLAEAKLWATNEKLARVIYFVADGQLYSYNINEKQETALTLQGLGAGEEIVYLRNRFWTGGSEKNFNYLAVGTQQGNRYKVYFYELQGATPTGAPVRILEGEGRLSSVHYITPEFEAITSRTDYPLSY
jgi:hypothetical protein